VKILQVNSSFSGGGTDSQTLDLTIGLRNLGEAVILAISQGSRWEPRARNARLRVETFPPRSPLKLAMIRKLIQIIRSEGCEIIHAHQGRDYWPSILAARLAGRGTSAVISRHLMTRPRRVSRWMLLRAAYVISVSNAVHAVLQKELKGPHNRLQQIYGGIDVERFQPIRKSESWNFRESMKWSPNDVVFGVVGAFDFPGGKGQQEFLEAGGQLLKRYPNTKFAVIGAGSLEAQLRQTMASPELRGSAVLVPFTNDIEMVIGALDVLVHPALGTEALGLVLWEAMASGKPVIASRLHGIPEAFIEGKHGMLVPPKNVGELFDAMERLAGNPGLRDAWGTAARLHVEQHFSREESARRTCDLYRQIRQNKEAP
jgi:glycosyltransferase involved in cell wall biosynthesis